MPSTHLIVDGAPEPVRHQHAHPPQLPAAATVLVGPQPRVGQAKANSVLEKRERVGSIFAEAIRHYCRQIPEGLATYNT